jgi:D-galactose 1-dehydrogenase
MRGHRIGIIGFGKIARDQHAPAIRSNPAFELVGAVSRHPVEAPPGVAVFEDHRALLAGVPGLDAVAVCTPPGARYQVARDALEAGKHVLLEKPPASTLGEVADLERLAAAAGCVLFAAWHSRFNPAVEAARGRLAGRAVRRVAVAWKEDVRRWHPGQRWIWEPGGFGVFDPGINALSILTRILPGPLFVKRAELLFPSNREAPIAATLAFGDGGGEAAGLGAAEFDWRQAGPQSWDILVATGDGTALRLSEGGHRLEVDGQAVDAGHDGAGEYGLIYRAFDRLLRDGRSEVDAAPLRLVADAFLVGRRREVEPFDD